MKTAKLIKVEEAETTNNKGVIFIFLHEFSYSKTGEYHKKNNLENQDYVFVQETSIGSFYAIADGVTVCENSRKGAEIACTISAKVILDDIDYYFDSIPQKTVNLVLSNIKHQICKIAKEMGKDELSFASTLCFVCIHKKRQKKMTFVLGDSKVFSLFSDKIRQINPVKNYGDNLTCTTMTNFAQEDVGFSVEDYTNGECFMLCTDGCWKELFYTDEDNQIIMRLNNTNSIEKYLENIETSDDCSFIKVS